MHNTSNILSNYVELSSLTTSESTVKLDEALAKAQGQFPVIRKKAENTFFKKDGKNSKYADISAVLEGIQLSLSVEMISVTQWPIASQDGRLHLLTRVAHKGEFMQATFSAPVVKQDPQGYGSALTYLRRYAISSILGVATEDDDDGNAASAREPVNPDDLSLKLKLQEVKITVDQFDEKSLKLELAQILAGILNDGKKLAKLHSVLQPLIKRTNKAVVDANGDPDKIQEVVNQVMTHIKKELK